MNQAGLASYIRWEGNVSTAVPWDNASLLPIVNMSKDQLAQAIVQINPNYFGENSHTDSVQNQQEYTKPSDLMLMKRVDVSYTDTNVGSFYPAKIVTLADLQPMGEDYYAANQPINQPLIRFDDTGFFLYPTPGANGSTTYGTGFIRLWYVPNRADLTDLTDSTNDIEALTGIGAKFHELIGMIVMNHIKNKKGELSALDMQNANQHILDVLVPQAFRELSVQQSNMPSDTQYQV